MTCESVPVKCNYWLFIQESRLGGPTAKISPKVVEIIIKPQPNKQTVTVCLLKVILTVITGIFNIE